MKRIILVAFLMVLALAAAGCGVINTITTLTGGSSSGNTKTVSQLWSDVPKMDGLTASQMDMPLPIKLVMQTVLGNLGRLNSAGQDQTTGNIDWIVFTSTKTPDDVRSYYTAELMATNGWQAGDQGGCMTGGDAGVAQIGALCVFQKQQGSQLTQLAIIAVQDDQTKQTNVFFLRLETSGTPTPGG
jgi:uncharacterized protein YceK